MDERIGILGGGQLGRMLAMAALRLGHKPVIYDPDDACPASHTCWRHIIAEWDDEESLGRFAEKCSVITFENENIPAATARFLETKAKVFPSSFALERTQDRALEKRFLHDIGVPTTKHHLPDNDIRTMLSNYGGKAILKTRTGGYDGKGQFLVKGREDIDEAVEFARGKEVIIEPFVDFAYEVSVLLAYKNPNEFCFYDIALNKHKDGILRSSTVPAPSMRLTLETELYNDALKIAKGLDYRGVLAVEFFIPKDSDICEMGNRMVNEIAPRIHNSGHWTEAACAVSQAEQHIRAIADMPLGSTVRHSNCEMTNVIGYETLMIEKTLKEELAAIPHLYGKEVRKGRKMGHINRIRPLQSSG